MEGGMEGVDEKSISQFNKLCLQMEGSTEDLLKSVTVIKTDEADTRKRVLKQVLGQCKETRERLEKSGTLSQTGSRVVETDSPKSKDRSIASLSSEKSSEGSIKSPSRQIKLPVRNQRLHHPNNNGSGTGFNVGSATPRLRFIHQIASFQTGAFFTGSPVAVARNVVMMPKSPTKMQKSPKSPIMSRSPW